MCGLAGVAYRRRREISLDMLARMGGALRHRGPDGFGFLKSHQIGLVHVRLSIRDIARGAQPLSNEDGSIAVIFNGEIYNDKQLRSELTRHGHRFTTLCDTEVLVHAYEEWGADMLPRLNGQFSFVIFDRRSNSLFLARDRFGIHPLFYSLRDGDLYFGSEAKALFASGEVDAAPDFEGLDQVFTFWASRPPRTVFRNISELEPGTFAAWRDGQLTTRRWHQFEYADTSEEPRAAADRLHLLMSSAVSLRLQADVPVGTYLSGGLDSSSVTAMAASLSNHQLRTFSVAFKDPQFDESAFQQIAATSVGSEHRIRIADDTAIADAFPAVVRHAETPMLRSAPAPLYLLSKLAKQNDIKVVLTGEGADEIFLGYDLFKETSLRGFCARAPASARRRALFKRLYPYMPGGRAGDLWAQFFLTAGTLDDPLFSHMPRILLASWIKQFYGGDMRAGLAAYDPVQELRDSLPPGFKGWSEVNRAAYLEKTTLLSPHLLSTQGDRMLAAHGVEGRYPFLDPRVSDFADALPVTAKLRGLHDKLILRRWASSVLPEQLARRPKVPYRAPAIRTFLSGPAIDYVRDLLSAAAIEKAGLFDTKAVGPLIERCRAGRATSVREEQALVGILSSQLWHHQFIEKKEAITPLNPDRADVVWNAGQLQHKQVCYGAA